MKEMFKLLYLIIGVLNVLSFNLPVGKWTIKGSNTILNINKTQIIINEGVSELSMKPNILNLSPLKLHLNSLEINKYPKNFDRRVFKAIKWIHIIKKHGIFVEFVDKVNDTTYLVSWVIDTNKGECILEKLS